jgi:hypothetical protein
VPSLDCSLLSITRHGPSGKGCSFIIEDGSMHLTFPNFSITAPVPSNGDLRLDLEVLSLDDWGSLTSLMKGMLIIILMFLTTE